MNRILVIGLTVAMLSLSSLYAMEKNGFDTELTGPDIVRKYLKDLQDNPEQVKTKFISKEYKEFKEFKEESVQKKFVDLVTSLSQAITFNSKKNKYVIKLTSLNREFIKTIKEIGYFDAIDAVNSREKKVQKQQELNSKEKVQKQQDTKWYHQVTNHKVRTTVLGVTAVLAFVAGNYYSRK